MRPTASTSPRPSGRGLALWLPVAAGLLAVGCPPNDVEVRVSEEGGRLVLQSCAGVPENQRCGPNQDHDLGPSFTTRLVLVKKNGVVADATGCVNMTIGGTNAGEVAGGMNAAIELALAGGLTFDGFQERSDATLLMMTYQSPLPPAPLGAEDPFAEQRLPPCSSAELIACAAFSQPSGSDVYDVSCAACFSGSPNGQGVCSRDNNCLFGVCDVSCVMEACEQVLLRNGL